MKNHFVLFGCAAAVLMIAACSSNPTTLPPGEYKKTERSVNEQGTETKKQTTTNVYYDEYGNKRATKETETSKDPKGLFNKSTSKTTETYN